MTIATNQLVSWAEVRNQVSLGQLKWTSSDPGTTTLPNALEATWGNWVAFIQNTNASAFSASYVPTWANMLTYRKLAESGYAGRYNSGGAKFSAGFNGADTQTIEFWVRYRGAFPASSAGALQFAVHHAAQLNMYNPEFDDNEPAYTGLAIGIYNQSTTGPVGLYVKWGQGDNSFSYSDVTGPTHLSPNTWYHVAVVCDALTGTLKTYLNGALESNATGAMFYGALNSPPFYVNGGQLWAPNTGNIDVDEVRFWNTARTAAQIAANYQHTVPTTSTGLIRYWKHENDFTDSKAGDNLSGSASVGYSFVTDTAF